MSRKNSIQCGLVLAMLLVAAFPALAARGEADFTRYVALGDSYGAGVSNGSVVVSHQMWSYPSVIARQVGIPVCGADPGCIGFQQPLVSQPGIGPELVLQSISPLVIGPKAAQSGSPINLMLQRPYNNLSVPGFRVGNLLTTTGAEQGSGAAQFILRGQAPAVHQALALNPTFISLWIGGNDVLGGVLAADPAVMTPIEAFRTSYAQVLDTLIAGAPNAGMVTGTISNPILIPFATTVPPVLVNPATNQPVLGPDGLPIFFIADLGGGQIGQLTPGSLVTLSATPFLATGYGIPPQLAPMFPQLPDAGKPLPAGVVITTTEAAAIVARANEVNDAIREIAGARDIPVVEFDELFSDILAGINFAGIALDASFITGGIFSLDGFHLTDIGYTLFANELIETINDAYGTEIPFASILPFFANNAPREEYGFTPPLQSFVFTGGAALNSLLQVGTPDEGEADDPPPARRRATRR
ncbi:MAG: SGNH/GDSL hydrolase family protein [Thermoanaerobaculia bacterium]